MYFINYLIKYLDYSDSDISDCLKALPIVIERQ